MSSIPEVFLKIKSQYSGFNSTEKKVANFILSRPEKVIYSTISQVAEQLEISDATVFRFCKKIGFKGFQAVKISLAKDFNEENHNSYINKKISDTDDEVTVLHKVFQANISSLNESLHSINPKNIKKAIDFLLNADQIVFYGNGGSGAVAMDAQHKFLRLGMRVSAYTDNHLQLMSAAQLGKNDVMVIISHSGSNLNMINLLEFAKENATKTIGITSFSKSPIDEKVDISLNAISQETEYQFEAFSSRIAHLTIIDALYVNVALKRKELSDTAIQKMRNAITYTKI
ncbi:MurR/RpiR family transcriptional regulator [Garciella nitratireducens]|uniref:MurR/RpiR family transcriptional regulator n=1 Tax=Garciella nitratireducens TaxID=218205 RepID=UPI000DE82E03|nr:MurR/RpiR family transcriptional regulator [Garciella nitratireducens]RBP46988.1 RpiR family transcriptional regulator [Garciella nitratireducens]